MLVALTAFAAEECTEVYGKGTQSFSLATGSPGELGMLKEIGCYTVRVLDGLRISHFGLYPHDLFLPHLTLTETLDDLFTGVRECAQEDKQITILSNDHRQEDNIISWLKDKTYILKPKV